MSDAWDYILNDSPALFGLVICAVLLALTALLCGVDRVLTRKSRRRQRLLAREDAEYHKWLRDHGFRERP